MNLNFNPPFPTLVYATDYDREMLQGVYVVLLL